MPRIQLDSETIYLSWGSQIWAHPRRADGTVCRTASQVLRAHSDDVSRFVTKDGLLVSGGRDKTIGKNETSAIKIELLFHTINTTEYY